MDDQKDKKNAGVTPLKPSEQKKEIPIICQRIKYFREKKNMEQKALAAALGIFSNAVSNWETGRTQPTVQSLPKICEVLEVNVNELFDMPAYGPPKPEPKPEPKPAITMTKKKTPADLVLEKYSRLSRGHRSAIDALIDKLCEAEDEELYNSITVTTRCRDQLSAGFCPGAELAGQGEPLHVYADKIDPAMDCVFPVSGDSMEPEFHNGDLVMVQQLDDRSELEVGEIGAFTCGNDAYIKVYTKAGLRSLNKKYKMIRFSEDDQVMIIGRVLGVLPTDAIASYEDVKRYEKAEQRIKEREEESDNAD